ncbi:hypothetical protein JDV02_009899 [Purpureocillium takamizusanense]|uniref:Bicarbonate transporter-like transmembrane domain-containing protein n=1 Tax=Purpureocillium takamizusanense TaxID=2060973 RepID=A0A9Q8VGP9_9HYPO|nr:uncharacterized protein JDV02_009899 [Purpureocillium takamizusanense]UNI24124.1 hypothetical protein JDV02_009899 [Purpureocillium takamizusanense]
MTRPPGASGTNSGSNVDVNAPAQQPTATPSKRPRTQDPEAVGEEPDPRGSSSRRSRRRGRYFGPDGALRPFRLLRGDAASLRARWPSDWTVFNQQVVASAVYVFFTNLLPGITFAGDLAVQTGRSWGTVEVVLSTGLCGVVFAVFSAQPLTILGVTGPFAVLAENIYKLCETRFQVDFLALMAWTLIHAGWMHVLLAALNAHDWTMRYVTHFSADIFSLLNSVIYVHKAALELQREHARARSRAATSSSLGPDNGGEGIEAALAPFLYAVLGAAGTCLLAVLLSTAPSSWAPLLPRWLRVGLGEYAAALSVLLWVGVPHVGDLVALDHARLEVQGESLRPSAWPARGGFVVEFWRLPVGWVFLAAVPGAIVTVLFFFDHEISSIICASRGRYGVRKPGGFAWDVALLGLTTAVCGVVGIPPANGLLPQAPLHTESLLYRRVDGRGDAVDGDDDDDDDEEGEEEERSDVPRGVDDPEQQQPVRPAASSTPSPPSPPSPPPPSPSPPAARTRTRTHEQRYSPLLQAALILAFIAPPLQRVLGLTPTSVLAGLFLFMAYQSLRANPMLARVGHLVTPPSALPPLDSGNGNGKVSWRGVHAFTAAQLLLTALVFGVTLTVAAPAFPLLVVALVPLRLTVMPRLWSRETLAHVDAWACRPGRPEDVRGCRSSSPSSPSSLLPSPSSSSRGRARDGEGPSGKTTAGAAATGHSPPAASAAACDTPATHEPSAPGAEKGPRSG